ncbi:MAG: DNA replication/repair protein RecF [Oscillospiraceae bacterium]|nr:DNA replication/repair protein RecF [Oscillospiraceae bacterium]
MKVTDYRSKDYRNLNGVCFQPDPGINVIYGENGQGKTNIVESIWLLTGCHSFRTHRHQELIKTGAKEASVTIGYDAHGMGQEARLKINQKREFTLNGIQKESPRRFLGEFQAVVFSPSSLSAIQSAPSERRRFLDIAVSMVKPAYASYLIRYAKILQNRNALLKQILQGTYDESALDPWDEELSSVGAKITLYRHDYLNSLSVTAGEIYREICGQREIMTLEYMQAGKDGAANEYELAENIFMSLQKNRGADIRRLQTSAGPHKDDLYITVDGMAARHYASQGQQRSCALSLKLGEAYIVKELSGEYPVVLLDDVMSELDKSRQTFLLEYLKNWQVFITCCDAAHFSGLKGAKLFRVENGYLFEE